MGKNAALPREMTWFQVQPYWADPRAHDTFSHHLSRKMAPRLQQRKAPKHERKQNTGMLHRTNGDTETPKVRCENKRFSKGEKHLSGQADSLQRKTSHWKNLRHSAEYKVNASCDSILHILSVVVLSHCKNFLS